MPRAALHRFAICFVLSMTFSTAARAQWAVVDVPATLQLIQEVQMTAQQLEVARNELLQARQTWQSMTGDRGMERLLLGTVRNYLPVSQAQLTSVMQGAGAGYPQLSTDVRAALAANAVLTPAQLAVLPPPEQRQITAVRQTNALREALAQEALANASNRFAPLQTLINAISTAADQKAILDLQARIGAELGMLQTEQTKLQVLHQATQALTAIDRQQEREQVVAGHGRFDTRFQPTP